jgi:hypothetical protein
MFRLFLIHLEVSKRQLMEPNALARLKRVAGKQTTTPTPVLLSTRRPEFAAMKGRNHGSGYEFTNFHSDSRVDQPRGNCFRIRCDVWIFHEQTPRRRAAVFFTTTASTSLTGFLFPFRAMTPAIKLGIISLAAVTTVTRYPLHLAWRRTYVITACAVLYFNVFVLVVQRFERYRA